MDSQLDTINLYHVLSNFFELYKYYEKNESSPMYLADFYLEIIIVVQQFPRPQCILI